MTTLGRRWSSLLVAVAFGCACASSEAGPGHPGRPKAAAMMRSAPFAQRAAARQEHAQAARAAREQPAAPQVPVAPVERPPETAPPIDRGGRPGRLTPDERRALRQQINDAGREIYRAPRQ